MVPVVVHGEGGVGAMVGRRREKRDGGVDGPWNPGVILGIFVP